MHSCSAYWSKDLEWPQNRRKKLRNRSKWQHVHTAGMRTTEAILQQLWSWWYDLWWLSGCKLCGTQVQWWCRQGWCRWWGKNQKWLNWNKGIGSTSAAINTYIECHRRGRDHWAYGLVSHEIDKEGKVCVNCKDIWMIYNIPAEDYKPSTLENHNDLDTKDQDKSEVKRIPRVKRISQWLESGAPLEMKNRNSMNGWLCVSACDKLESLVAPSGFLFRSPRTGIGTGIWNSTRILSEFEFRIFRCAFSGTVIGKLFLT